MISSGHREQIRLATLRYLESADRFGLTTPLLLQFLRSEGFRALTREEFAAELTYLADKSLIAPVPKLISPENEAWRVTATGRDLLATREQGNP